MNYYLGVAEEKGITEQELEATLYIVMAASATRVRANLREVKDKYIKK